MPPQFQQGPPSTFLFFLPLIHSSFFQPRPGLLWFLKTFKPDSDTARDFVTYLDVAAFPCLIKFFNEKSILKEGLLPLIEPLQTNASSWLNCLANLIPQTITFNANSKDDASLESQVLAIGLAIYFIHDMGEGNGRPGFDSAAGWLFWHYRFNFAGTDQKKVQLDKTVRQVRSLLQQGKSITITFWPINWRTLRVKADLQALVASKWQFRDDYNEYKWVGNCLEFLLMAYDGFANARTKQDFFRANPWTTSAFESLLKVISSAPVLVSCAIHCSLQIKTLEREAKRDRLAHRAKNAPDLEQGACALKDAQSMYGKKERHIALDCIDYLTAQTHSPTFDPEYAFSLAVRYLRQHNRYVSHSATHSNVADQLHCSL